jgi:hypothetical protein
MRAAKSARDCSQSLVSQKERKKHQGIGALLENEVGKM